MTDHQPEAPAGELAALKRSARILANIVARNHQAMEAARIEMRQNGPHAGMQWILNSLPDVWDDPETEWDGKESAEAWFDRTEAFYRATQANSEPPDVGSPATVPSNPAPSILEPSSGNEGGASPTPDAASRERAALAGCPTPCDPDCELSPDGCHQSHDPVHKRWHDPGWSCGEVQRAIAEAVSAERARAEQAEARLAAIEDHRPTIRHALACALMDTAPGSAADAYRAALDVLERSDEETPGGDYDVWGADFGVEGGKA